MKDREEIIVSPQALERMRGELDELTTTGREAMGERLMRAREFGDIRENAEYDAAKDAQGLMEARIRRLEYLIKNAVVREGPSEAHEAVPGVVVTVQPEGEEQTERYLLAASAEERLPGIRTVSTSSPLGAALIGKKRGETAVVNAPGGTFLLRIVGLDPL